MAYRTSGRKPDFCGEACVEMFARKRGVSITQDDVFDISGMDPILGRGVTTRELQTAIERLGMQPGAVFQVAEADRAAEQMEGHFAALHADLLRGVPSIVCMRYDDSPRASEHMRLVLGYDPITDEILFHEPAEEAGAYRRMHRADFLRRWPLKYAAARWTVIRLALDGGELRAPPPASKPSRADYVQRVMSIHKRTGRGFSLKIEPPFVVVGDASQERVDQHATHTVRWAVERLKRDFFARDPEQAMDVWLFSGKDSYYDNVKRLFGTVPDTTFGYYSAEHRALVMNIATGGGTLVHEIVHPYMAANAPGAPPWLNEGLASLYEAAAEDKDGHIIGRLNWRLPGLKRAAKRGKLVPLHDLFTQGDKAFYADDSGVHYAEARYLLFYLQERGALVPFFRRWLSSRDTDPTGEKALVAESGEADLQTLQRRFETFVAGL
jgi:hypothetical protein